MALKTKKWDAAKHLDSPQAIMAYLEAAAADGDPRVMAAALGNAGRAIGMAKIAIRAGKSRSSLYRSLRHGSRLELATFLSVLKALNLKIFTSGN